MAFESIGTILICLGIAVYLVVTRSSTAEILYRYYNSRPDPSWRPHWLLWQFRPTHRQANALPWIGIGLSLTLAIVVGLISFTG